MNRDKGMHVGGRPLLLVGAFLALVAPISALGQEPAQDAIVRLIRQAAAATGEEYLAVRGKLENVPDDKLREAAKKVGEVEDWKVSLICEIIAERQAKIDELREFSQWTPPAAQKDGKLWRLLAYSPALAKRAKHFPMMLAEAAWKDIGLDQCPKQGERRLYALYALVELPEVAREMRLLFEFLLGDDREDIQEAAAENLALVRDRRSLPALLKFAETAETAPPKTYDGWSGRRYPKPFRTAVGAIAACATVEDRQLLEVALGSTKRSDLADMLRAILTRLNRPKEPPEDPLKE